MPGQPTDSPETVAGDLEATATSWRSTVIAYIVLVCLTLVFFHEATFSGKSVNNFDSAAIYVPLHVENARLRAEGEIPLWNSHALLGLPTHAENELSGVYPPSLVFNLVGDTSKAYTSYLLFHYLLALAGMMYLASVVGARLLGQTVAALTFVLGGTFVGITYIAALMTTVAWLPWILGLQLRALETRRYRLVIIAGVLLALQTSGAHPQVSFFTLLVLLLAMLHEFRFRKGRKGAFFAVKATGLILFVGLGLAAPQVAYCIEFISSSPRWQGLGTEQQLIGSLPPQYFLQLLVPNLLGTSTDVSYYLCEMRIYFGILALGLLAWGCRVQSRFRPFLLVSLVIAILLALGRFGGIYLLLVHLPGFQQIHNPSRFLLILALIGSTLVGLGADQLLNHWSAKSLWRSTTARIYGVLAVLLLVLGVASITASPDGSLHRFYRQLLNLGMQGDNWGTAEQLAAFGRWSLLAAGWCVGCLVLFLLLARQVRRPLVAACLLLLLAADLFVSNQILPFGPPGYYRDTPEPIAWLQKQPGTWRVAAVPPATGSIVSPDLTYLPSNVAALFELDALNYHTASRQQVFDQFFGDSINPMLNTSPRELGVFNVRFLVLSEAVPELASQLRFEHGDCRIYENPDWQERISVREDYRVVPQTLLAIKDELNSEGFDLRSSVLLHEQPGPFLDGTPRSVDDATLEIQEYSARTILLQVELPRQAILVVSDLHYPGWTATSNGRPLPVLVTNGLTRGLALGPGRHEIVWNYRPASFYQGYFLTASVLLFLAAWGLVIRFKSRQPPRRKGKKRKQKGRMPSTEA